MEYVIILMEVLAFFALILFGGVLDSKYYERKPIKYLDWLTWGLMGLAFAIVMLSAESDINKFNMRLVWHLSMVMVICYCLYKFPKIDLKYDRQYYFACYFLILMICFEAFAIITNGLEQFSDK